MFSHIKRIAFFKTDSSITNIILFPLHLLFCNYDIVKGPNAHEIAYSDKCIIEQNIMINP